MLPRRLTICADDFGMAPPIDAAILDLVHRGRLTAVSCLCDGPSLVSNAAALAALPVEIGLHLNLTETFGGAPLTGLVRPLRALIVAAYLRRLDRARVTAEVARQFERFFEVMGREPDFVDGHQHVHQLPVVRTALFEVLARRFSERKPWIRSTRFAPRNDELHRSTFKARVIAALGDSPLRAQAAAAGIRTNGALLGVYDFRGGAEAYRRHLALWLAQARDGDLLMCHPACRAIPGDPLGAQRAAEYEVLAAPQFARNLVEQRIVPAGQATVPEDTNRDFGAIERVSQNLPTQQETAAQKRP